MRTTSKELWQKARPLLGSAGKRYSLRAAFLLALLPGVLGALLLYWPPMESLERTGLDLLFLMRGTRPSPAQVLVVAIDDDSYWLKGVDPEGAWPRSLHAELIRTLHAQGARAVAFDVLFVEAGDPEQDDAFEQALADTGITVLGATVEQIEDPRFRRARLIEPHPRFAAAAAAVADVNLPTDRDGVIRSTWLLHDERPSLALAAYQVATGDEVSGERSTRLIDYYGPARTIPTISIYQALEPDQYLPQGFFKDRIVFVGLSQDVAAGPAAKDAFLTPFRGRGGRPTYGVEIHATIAANLLEGRRINILPRVVEWVVFILLPVAAVLILMYSRPVLGVLVLIGFEALVLISGHVAFTTKQLWIPLLVPALVQLPMAYVLSLIWYYLTTVRERERIRQAFSFYLSPEMSELIAENPDSLDVGGEEMEATAMFTDIKGFSSIAEILNARETATLLNEYFSGVTQHIFEVGGTLIKYIGDAVFAIWGAPVKRSDHATAACLAAVGLVRTQETVSLGAAGYLITRIGVHTGHMLVGNLGSAQRFDYTAIGDAVNLASRLEGINKPFGTLAIASGETISQTNGQFEVRRLGRIRVVGRKEPVEIYQLLGCLGDQIDFTGAARDRFKEALEHYTAGRLQEAEACFRETEELCDGKDGPSRFYLDRISSLKAEPLPSDWDGVVNFTSK
jgi:adenylate cyclase